MKRRSTTVGARALAAIGLLLLLAGILTMVVTGLAGGHSDGGTASRPGATRARTPRPAPQHASTTTRKPPVRVPLRAVAAFDPFGDHRENDGEVGLAVDGDTTTYWRTERYHSFSKPGVGLLLDAGRRVRLAAVTLVSDTPGFPAEIRAGNDPTGPFRTVAPSREVNGQRVFRIRSAGARYILVWLTGVPPEGEAHLNEVRATASP
jgi:hypothetical protein